MRLRLKTSLAPSATSVAFSHYDFLQSAIGEKELEPLGVSTLQNYSGTSSATFLNSLDSFGDSLQYSPIEIFEVVENTIPNLWVIHLYSTINKMGGSPFFIGLPGLEDEKFIERVMDRESEKDILRFSKITSKVKFHTARES